MKWTFNLSLTWRLFSAGEIRRRHQWQWKWQMGREEWKRANSNWGINRQQPTPTRRPSLNKVDYACIRFPQQYRIFGNAHFTATPTTRLKSCRGCRLHLPPTRLKGPQNFDFCILLRNFRAKVQVVCSGLFSTSSGVLLLACFCGSGKLS